MYIYISESESHGRNGSHRSILSPNPTHTCNNLQCPSNMVESGVLEELGIAVSETSMRSVTDPKSGASPNMSSAPGIFSEGMVRS